VTTGRTANTGEKSGDLVIRPILEEAPDGFESTVTVNVEFRTPFAGRVPLTGLKEQVIPCGGLTQERAN
jgi:hypothetical protein